MNPASFVGQLLGVALAIWFLFFRKRAMPNFQKWAFSFGLSLLFLLAMIGLGALIETSEGTDIDAQLQSGLDTKLHKRVGGTWDVGVGTSAQIWRFVSHRELIGEIAEARRESGMISVKGSYKTDWHNDTDKKFNVTYHLRFLDSNDLEIAQYIPYGRGLEFILLPAATKEVSGIFEIKVGNLEAANSISSMRIYASFDEVDE